MKNIVRQLNGLKTRTEIKDIKLTKSFFFFFFLTDEAEF